MHMNMRVKLHLCLSTVAQKGVADQECTLPVPGFMCWADQPGKVYKFDTKQVR